MLFVSSLVIIIYQALMSFYWPLPALIAIDSGMGARFIGLIVAISTVCQLISSLFWPKYARFSDKTRGISLGFIGILVGSVLLQNINTLIPAVIVLSILPGAAYYSLLNDVRNNAGSLSENVSSFLKKDSVGRLIGFTVGTLGAFFFTTSQLPILLFTLAIFSALAASGLSGGNGWYTLVDDSLVEIQTIDRGLRSGRVFWMVNNIGLEKAAVPYMLTSALFSFGFATIFAQMTVIIEMIFGNALLFYLMSLLSRIFMIIAYQFAGRVRNPLMFGYLLRSSMIGFLLLGTVNKWLMVPFFMLSGAGLSFLLTFYNLRNLKLGSEMVSLNVSARLIAYSIGSYLSGLILETGGIIASGLVSLTVVLLAPLPFLLSTNRLKPLAWIKFPGKNRTQKRF